MDSPYFGYHPNASKTFLIVKEHMLQEATNIFENSGVQITTEGRKYLGCPLGTAEFNSSFCNNLVSQFLEQLKNLSKAAYTYSHEAYAAYVTGLKNKWSYFARCISNFSEYVRTLEETLVTEFMPSLTGTPCSELHRDLYAVPVCKGGLGLPQLMKSCEQDYTFFSNCHSTTRWLY